MKTFFCLIKSGTDFPDFDITVDAKTKKEAVNIILKTLKWTDNPVNRRTVNRGTIQADIK